MWSPVPRVVPNSIGHPQCHVVPIATRGSQRHTPSPTQHGHPQCYTWSPTPHVVLNATHHPQLHMAIPNATRGSQLHMVTPMPHMVPSATCGPQLHGSSPMLHVVPNATHGPQHQHHHMRSPPHVVPNSMDRPQHRRVPKVDPNPTGTPSGLSLAQVPLRQTAAAADGAADTEDGEHTADPTHPGPLQHDSAALRNHQLKATKALSPHPRARRGAPSHFTGQSKALLFFQALRVHSVGRFQPLPAWPRGETEAEQRRGGRDGEPRPQPRSTQRSSQR